jgi:hypothetical protein
LWKHITNRDVVVILGAMALKKMSAMLWYRSTK